MTDIEVINYLGCIMVILQVIAGVLIPSKDYKLRAYGVSFFFSCNITALNLYYLTGLFSALLGVLVFVPINIINFYRTINNLK